MDGNIQSVQQQASANNLPYNPFALRELITPQHKVEVDFSTDKGWANWVGEHAAKRTVHRPTTRKELVATVVRKAHSVERIRAVGSGHSHSNAPEPPQDYIELNPGEPGDAGDSGLNNVLDHKGWLKPDNKLLDIQASREGTTRRNGTENRPDPLDGDHLKRLQSGIILRRLNRHLLHKNGYALKNMGSFDGQTIAGAVNTSTHGTGVGLASISDSVESVEIVTVPDSESGDPIVRMYRIEPSDGITDREAFEADTGDHEMELIQDDDVFHSVVVGYGCMGVVYAYTLHVRDSYWLREETELMNWEQLTDHLSDENGEVTSESVKSFLTKSDDAGTPCRHTQILVNIAADQVPEDKIKRNHPFHDADHQEGWRNPLCLIRRHYPTDEEQKPSNWEVQVDPREPHDKRWPPERRKKSIRDLAKAIGTINPLAPNLGKAKQVHNQVFHPEHRKKPFVQHKEKTAWYVALRRLRDRHPQKADEYRHPHPPDPPTVTTEVAVQLENVVDAAEAIRERIRPPNPIRQAAIEGKTWKAKDHPVFFAIPMGIRFTAASEHYLSPEKERPSEVEKSTEQEQGVAMLEVPMPINPIKENLNHQTPELNLHEIRELVVEPALTELHNHLVFTAGSNSDPPFEARPHMGKHNTVGKGWLRANYDYFDANAPGFPEDAEVGWLQVYNRFNAFGTFDNKFTEQLGISNSQG
jgi:hypothetical protein